MTLLRGCDVSVFQAPSLVPWSTLDFGIVQSTYGAAPDKNTLAHVSAIRKAEKVLGLYHFFRADQAPAKQLEVFESVATLAELSTGDLLPCIDVEDFPTHTIGPADMPALAEFDRLLCERFGGTIIYTTQRDWSRLGKPAWVLERPLWVAHYPRAGATSPLANPATPDNRLWRIWQNFVGKLGSGVQDPANKAAVDQNVALEPLPLIGGQPVPYVAPEASVPFVGLTDDDWAEMTAARDHRVYEDSNDECPETQR